MTDDVDAANDSDEDVKTYCTGPDSVGGRPGANQTLLVGGSLVGAIKCASLRTEIDYCQCCHYVTSYPSLSYQDGRSGCLH